MRQEARILLKLHADRRRREAFLVGLIMEFFKNLSRKKGFPKNYVVFDLETSGLSLDKDLICQVGYCVVDDGKMVESRSFLLNWPNSKLVRTDWLHNRILNTKYALESKGKKYAISFDDLMSRGYDPLEVLSQYRLLLLTMVENGYDLVSHGGYSFDLPMLKSNLSRYLDLDIEIGNNDMWDTGMIEKASQLNILPNDDDTLESFCKRVNSMAYKDVRWSLDGHCVPKYGLDKKYGLSADRNHDAEYDSYVCHLLFEEFKSLAQKADGEMSWASSSV